jgi:hypothetical protein
VIPEQEMGSLQADLQPDAKQVLRDFVSAGGNFVTFAQHEAVLDAIFGYSIGTTGPNMSGNADKQPIAASTPYGGGPATLAPNSAVYGMHRQRAAPAAKVVYQRTELALDYGVVVLIPYGTGTITYFGWNWYSSNPPQGGGAGRSSSICATARAGSYRVVIRNAKGRVLTKRTLRTCVP